MNNEKIIQLSGYRAVTIENIADEIQTAKKTLILSHMNPDGDTIGSAFALRDIISACGGSAFVSCHDEIPRRLNFLADEGAFLRPPLCSDEFDMIISVDTASPAQLGCFGELIPDIRFMIDHHAMGEAFAPNYIDASAAATGEIIYSLYSELKSRGKVGVLPDAARKIYAAIVSDTGSFKFSNTTPITHRIAADLVDEINSAQDNGMNTADLCRSLFGQRTLKELTAQMLAIQNLRFYENGRLGAVLFTSEMLKEADLAESDVGNSVDTPRGVEGVLVGISVRQLEYSNQYKVSSRANAEIDVAAVCAKFGGGGHVRAAGCTIAAETPEAALEMAVGAFGDEIRSYCLKLQESEK